LRWNLLENPLIIILLCSGLGVVILGLVDMVSSSVKSRRRIAQYVMTEIPTIQNAVEPAGDITKFRAWLNDALSILSSEGLRHKLIPANWPITDREYILIQFGITILGFLIGWAISRNIIGGIGLAIVAYIIPNVMLARAGDVRRQRFQNQLLDALILIRGAVQSGLSLLQALSLVKDELPPPASEEFSRVVREMQIGLPLQQALLNLCGRMQSDDLYMVVTAIVINSQVGGNLTTMLDSVTNTIRARLFLFGEVRALTSYARYTGYLLTLLPFLTTLLIYLANPSYFETVSTSIIAQIILVLAFIAMILGNIWIRRIVKIKV
jgi:tight adherence protein B